MLECQQVQLVAGLHKLYQLCQSAQGSFGSPLNEPNGGVALTHDILAWLGVMKHVGCSPGNTVDKEFSQQQPSHTETGGDFMPREFCSESDSQVAKSPMTDEIPSVFAHTAFWNGCLAGVGPLLFQSDIWAFFNSNFHEHTHMAQF